MEAGEREKRSDVVINKHVGERVTWEQEEHVK